MNPDLRLPPPPKSPRDAVEVAVSLLAPEGTWACQHDREYRQEALETTADLPERMIEKFLERPLSLNELRALLVWARKHRRERADYWEARVYRRMTRKGT